MLKMLIVMDWSEKYFYIYIYIWPVESVTYDNFNH